MSLTVQWIITGLVIAAAAVYVVYKLGWWRRDGMPVDPGCGSCPGCPAIEDLAERLAAVDLSDEGDSGEVSE